MPCSCHCCAIGKACSAPSFVRQDVVQDRGGGIDVGVAEVQWRETEAHEVGAAEIADHPLVDQSLHDLVAMWMAQRDLTAAPCPLARRRQSYAEGATAFLDEGDKQVREPKALFAHLIEFDVVPNLERAGKCAHGEDRLCSTQHGADAVTRSEGAIKGERARMAPPTRERLREFAVMAAGGKHKRWRARATIEVFVRGANGEIGAVGIEIDLEHARAVTEIPYRDRACLMDAPRECGHVAQHAGAIVHVVNEHHSHVATDQVLDARAIDTLKPYAHVWAQAG